MNNNSMSASSGMNLPSQGTTPVAVATPRGPPAGTTFGTPSSTTTTTTTTTGPPAAAFGTPSSSSVGGGGVVVATPSSVATATPVDAAKARLGVASGTRSSPSAAVTAATSPTSTTAAPALSKTETDARKKREQEEANLRAQFRKDKQEFSNRSQQIQPTSVLGSSGVSGLVAAPSSVATSSILFNPYDFLMGTTGQLPSRKFAPIYRTPPFWALLELNTYISQKPVPPEFLKDRSAMYAQLSKSLSFVCYVNQMSTGGGTLDFLKSNHMACEACIKLISLLPHSAGASGQQLDGLFLNFLNVFLNLIEKVQPNQQLVLPGGWQQPEYTYVCLYIIRNCGNNRWSFTVCNTGDDGMQYHPATFDPETGRLWKQLAMTVWDIPSTRVLDSTFWTLLFRMQVYPSRKNTAAFLYTKLLPALNSRPLLSNLDQGPAEYLDVPHPIAAQSYHPLARLALTTTPALGYRSSKYATLLVMHGAVELAYQEIERLGPGTLDPEDTRILKLAGRNLANFSSVISPNTVGDGSLGGTLSGTWELLDKLLQKLAFATSKPIDHSSRGLSNAAMNDDFAQGKIVSMKTHAGSAAHPLFGRLRRDNYASIVKNLMGEPRPDPILIPAVLTDEELPPVATDYASASSYMQRVADACSLLLQQRRLLKNAPAFASSAAQHALMHVLPMPNSDAQFCFWRRFPMRRETQLNLLFLIRRLCRIYAAATACVQQSRGLIAVRATTLACGACVADAICRAVATDDPSVFALHYSGLCEGPTEAFGIEAGSYDTLGANLPITDPAICSLRFQCLEYLRCLTFKADGGKRHTIFNFDKALTPMESDLVLVDQLSIQLALERPYPKVEPTLSNRSASLISGANGSIIEVLPEFEYFRDIVFHFKHAVSGKAATPENVPNHVTWIPSDATLHWTLKRKEKEEGVAQYAVTAFKGHPQEFVPREAQQEQKTKDKLSYFKGFKTLFTGKTRIERSRLSSADPTTVVNSCGDKFIKKK